MNILSNFEAVFAATLGVAACASVLMTEPERGRKEASVVSNCIMAQNRPASALY